MEIDTNACNSNYCYCWTINNNETPPCSLEEIFNMEVKVIMDHAVDVERER